MSPPLPRHDATRRVTTERAPLPSDEDLVLRVSWGQDHAFDLLVARYGGRLQAFLRHLVGDEGAAEDLCQDVLVKILRHAGDRAPTTAFSVWLFRIARNHGLNHLRSRRIHDRALSLLKSTLHARVAGRSRSPLDHAEEREFDRQLDREIGRLPEELRTAFLLRERESMTYEQIAVVQGTTPKTVSTRIHRARVRLRDAMAPWLDFSKRATSTPTIGEERR